MPAGNCKICGVYFVYTGYNPICYSCSQETETRDDVSGGGTRKKCKDCGKAITIGKRCYRCASGLGPKPKDEGRRCLKCNKRIAAPAKYCFSCSSF